MKKLELNKLDSITRNKVIKWLDDYGYDMGKPEIIEMSPDEFLKIAPLPKFLERRELVQKIKKMGYREGRYLTDMPWIDKAEIEDHRENYLPSHEGRNRALALKEMGIKKMKVVLFDTHKKWARRPEWMKDFKLSEKEVEKVRKLKEFA